MDQTNKLTVLIAGSGRSGSTFLDFLLNNSLMVQSLGEVPYLNRAARLQNEMCTCGVPVTECSFWMLVEKLAKENVNLPESDTVLKDKEMMPKHQELESIAIFFQKVLLVHGNKFCTMFRLRIGRAYWTTAQNLLRFGSKILSVAGYLNNKFCCFRFINI